MLDSKKDSVVHRIIALYIEKNGVACRESDVVS